MANVLLDVVDTFNSLDTQYNMLRVACQTQADRDALEAKYGEAQDNAEDCTGQCLEDDDADIAALGKELRGCNDKLKNAEAEMGDMSKVLDNLTQALTIGSKFVGILP